MTNSISDYIKNARIKMDLSTQKFSELFDVSAGYITQLEQGKKMPSKKKLFELLLYFNEMHKSEGFYFPVKESIEEYTKNKKTQPSVIMEEYDQYKEEYINLKNKSQKNFLKFMDSFNTGGFAISKIDDELTMLEKPYFDLNWLLTQKEYHVLYNSSFNFDNEFTENDAIKTALNSGDELSKTTSQLFRIVLPEEDVITINNIIHEFLKNKYEKNGVRTLRNHINLLGEVEEKTIHKED